MEPLSARSHSGERPFPPSSSARTASRSSITSGQTRMTSAGANSSSRSQPPSSPQHSSSSIHSSTRLRRRAWSRSSAEPSRSHLSREVSDEARAPVTPVSALLQERLQKERRVESQRSLTRMSSGRMSAPLDLRASSQASPTRGAAPDVRPQSSGGADPAKKGLGLKEMEQTLSTLHKQNFDLKLEVFHRRERETALEQRVETLETKQNESQTMNEKLLEELEKRDKAVEEAVAMIVVLEARVEQLLREREMVRQVDADGYFPSPANQQQHTPAAQTTPTPKMHRSLEPARDDARSLHKMPSFLSEHHESTENLRNVYLGVRGSIVSLPRTSLDGDRPDHHDFRSPSLSVLSESSFVSVYGQKDEGAAAQDNNDNAALDRSPDSNLAPRKASNPRPRIITPSKTLRRTSSRATGTGSPRIQNMNGVLDSGGSPLLRLAKLENTLTAMEDDDDNSSPARSASPSNGKQDRRDALHKVLTNAPPTREVAHPNGLPPTPDTISTSILRRYKNSNDTLPREPDPDLANERSYLALSETTASLRSSSGAQGGGGFDPSAPSQSASTTAFSSRKDLPTSSNNGLPYGDGYHDQQHFLLGEPIPARPRSAGESIASRQRRFREADWDSNSDGGDLDGVESRASSLDYWMRESLKPNRPADAVPPNPLSSASQAGGNKTRRDRRISPDLFSFPSGAHGWATDAMFGPLSGTGYHGTTGSSGGVPTPTTLAQALAGGPDGGAVPPSLFGPELTNPVLEPSGTAPPPPDRRSSLHARTGSSIPGTPARPVPTNGKLRKSPERGNRSRSNSVDWRPSSRGRSLLGFSQPRAPTAPPESTQQQQQQQQNAQQQKQRHYPPTASQPARSRGLSSLFRRSIGSGDAPASSSTPNSTAAPSSAPPTETSFRNNAPPSTIGVPSWGKRADLDDDRDSATPPPIMRKRVGGKGSFDGGAALDSFGGGAPVGVIPEPSAGPSRLSQAHYAAADEQTTMSPPPGDEPSSFKAPPATPERASGNAKGEAVSGKRKWLALGRSSLRNRAA